MKADSLKVKIFVFTCFWLFFPAVLNAVDARKVKVVQNKDVLENADLQIIDIFVEEAIAELVETKDFSAVSAIRDELVANSSSRKVSSEKQYRTQFIKSVSEYISAAFKSSQKLAPDIRFKISVNLLMVIDGLRDVQLSSLALDRLDDSNAAVRYWAMKCFSSDVIIKQLNDAAGNAALTSQIISRLNKLIANCDDTMLVLITNFASDLKAAETTDLLIKIADLRLQQYAKWQVKEELTDGVVLKALYNKNISKQGMPETARRFAQMYSYVFQRYIKGDNLSDEHRQKLMSVMADIEEKCVSKLLPKQTKVKEALEIRDRQEQLAALTTEHDSLLGSASSEGRLPAKLQFRYRSANGQETSAPAELPAPAM